MTSPIIFHCDPETVELRQTVRLQDLDGCLTIARRADGRRPRFVWRGPATDFGLNISTAALLDPSARSAVLWIDDIVAIPVSTPPR